MSIKFNRITFYSRKFSSYIFLSQGHYKLITFRLISTSFRPPVSKVLDKVLCFILGREFCHKNVSYIFGSSSTITFGTLVIKAR